jgi:hypothetical protein
VSTAAVTDAWRPESTAIAISSGLVRRVLAPYAASAPLRRSALDHAGAGGRQAKIAVLHRLAVVTASLAPFTGGGG